MRAVDLITNLTQQGVQIWAEGDRLHYRAPKGVINPAIIKELAESKRELLHFLGQQEKWGGISFPQIEPALAQRYQPFPLTDIQLAYWIGRGSAFEMGNVGNHGYIEVDALDLDVPRMQIALQRLIERHEMLRAILLPDGQQQILEHTPPFHIKVFDLREQDSQAAMTHLIQLRRSMDHQMIQVEQWPAFELCVTLLDQRRSRLHMSVEFLFIDAWSVGILIREFAMLYANPETVLTPLTLSFRDYVITSDRELHQSQSPAHRLAQEYWLKRFPDLPPAPELPLVKNPRALARPRFISYKGQLDASNWMHVKTRAARSGITPSSVLLTAFAEILATWSKSSRFSINLTLFNRQPLHPQIEDLVGDFTSLVPVAVDYTQRDTFENRARRVQEQIFDHLEHSHYGGMRLLKDLARAQNEQIGAILPVVFTSTLIQNGSDLYSTSGPWEKLVYAVTQTPQVWLDHQVLEVDGTLVFYWVVVEELFPEGFIAAMFETYSQLLQRLATREESWQGLPGSLVPCIQMEQQANLNMTQAPLSEELLHTLFTKQAIQHPSHLAVVTSTRRVTYQEVYRGAAHLAHWLRAQGAQPNHLVAVVMEKGWEQVVAVLGILYAGAAYVPIDPGLPQERLTYLLENAEVEIVLTQSWLDDKIAWTRNQQRFHVDRLNLEDRELSPLSCIQTPRDLAYVIYTSGSTGQPKGVMIDHLGAVNTILDINERFGVNSNDRVLALSALHFDLSVYDIFGTLAAGGTIVLPPEEARYDPATWLSLLLQEHITLWNSVPALLQVFLEHIDTLPEHLRQVDLRLALLSGDWIPLSLPARLCHLVPGVQVISLGGATEASIWSIFYPIVQLQPTWKSIPYGRPLRNQRWYILNDRLDPCPTWVPGQLYIAGLGLAQGYWRDAAKTQASFLTHPDTGERLYKTGDLGRYLPDGLIEFLGREDFQVKVQGHRIELGEIEAALLQHPDVHEAVAMAVGDQFEKKQIIAYVVPERMSGDQGEEIGETPELYALLEKRLPRYMLPAQIIKLEKLPLTANGKVDRKNLPQPEKYKPGQGEEFIAPRTVLEETLVGILARVLDMEQISIHENFFQLGIDSILSIEIVSLMRKQGLNCSVQQIFQYPTVAELAETVRIDVANAPGIEAIRPWSLIIPEDRQKVPTNIEDAYPLSGLQAGMIFYSQYYLDMPLYHIMLSYYLRVPFHLQFLQLALQNLVTIYPVLRTHFDLHSFSEPLQLVAQSLEIPVQVEDLREYSSLEQEALLKRWREKEKGNPFDWSSAPLFRVQIHRRSEQTFQLSFSFHHAILDGWSGVMVVNEFFTHYLSLLKGQRRSVEPSLTQFRDFVALERNMVHSEDAQRYWMRALSDSPQPLLPRWSASRESRDRTAIFQVDVPISESLSMNLKQHAQELGVPLKSVLLAVHLRVVSLLCGQQDILTGLLTNGRPETTDGERAVGMFLNILPMRLTLRGGTWAELAQETFVTERDMLPYRWYPLAEMQKLQGGRTLFETLFNFTYFPLYQDTEGPQIFQILALDEFLKTEIPLVAHFSLDSSSSRIRLFVRGNPVDFAFEQIETIGGYYARALAAFSAAPQGYYEQVSLLGAEEYQQLLQGWYTPLNELPLLAEPEQQSPLHMWNETQTEQPVEHFLHTLFEEQAARVPDAIAVVYQEEYLTYEQLNVQANRLAHYLRQLGIGPEKVVGIALERSLWLIISLLAVLKAGGTYLSLDLSYPAERLAFMLEDAQVNILLTEHTFLNQLPSTHAHIICLDRAATLLATQKTETLSDNGLAFSHLAYIAYTSGSTGTPKGVMISHAALATFFQVHLQRIPLESDETSLAVLSPSFDAAALAWYLPLLVGAKVVMASRETVMDGQALARAIEENNVTMMASPPAIWHLLLQAQWSGNPHLTIYCGGEALSSDLAEQLLERSACLLNLYGPTETTIYSIGQRVLSSREGISIGYPLATTQVYVLDQFLHPVPLGCVGELYLGGDGLACGYLNQPALTAERFMPNPFATQPGSRIYRTGDLARYREDRSLECLGRIDQQVKVRGFRIELGEIESVLVEHPAIQACVVVVRANTSGEMQLVAYIVPGSSIFPGRGDLRRFLQRRLPEYMVPSYFSYVETLPLTPAGKVDQRLLPVPQDQPEEREMAQVVPHTPLEELLIAIWCEVLERERIGVNENFFDLGGHSLLVMQLIAKVRSAVQLEVPMRSLYEAPTIAELAAQIELLRTRPMRRSFFA